MPEQSPDQRCIPKEREFVLDLAILLKQNTAEQQGLAALDDHVCRRIHLAPDGLALLAILGQLGNLDVDNHIDIVFRCNTRASP